MTLPAPPRPLQVGLLLPTSEGMLAGNTAGWLELRAVARLAEDVGFQALWVMDHLLIPVDRWIPGAEPMGAWECWSVLAALAAVTTHVQLGTLMTCAPFRNPALLAKMAATVDEVSGGRLILGLGAGSVADEFAAFGYPSDHLVDRFAEALRMIRGLLRDGRVDVAGRYYRARECELRPRGPRPAGPPVWVGARGPRMDRLAARFADGWNAAWPNRASMLEPRLAAIDEACADVGRDPRTLVRTAGVMIDLPGIEPPSPWPWAEVGRAPARPLRGSAQEIAAELRAIHRLGISHVQVWLEPTTRKAIESFAPVLALVARGDP